MGKHLLHPPSGSSPGYRFKKLRFIGIAQGFLKSLTMVIALVQKGLAYPSLSVVHRFVKIMMSQYNVSLNKM